MHRILSYAIMVSVFTGVLASAAGEPVTALEDKAFYERLVMKYWGNYSGPQIANPNQFTTDPQASTSRTAQNFDDLLTLGYQVTPDFRPGIGMPFNLILTNNPQIQIKPLYFGIIDATLVKSGNFSIHTDFRVYTPIGDIAQTQNVKTGFRASQVTLYPIPHSSVTVGCYTYVRTWIYGDNGRGYRNDLEIYLSPFASYRLSSSFSLTLWSDWLQLGHQFATPWGLKNLPVDVQPGFKWDITDKININPYLNFIPAHLAWDALNLGMVVNAQLL